MTASPTTTTPCPDPDLIVRLSGNDLAPDRAAAVEEHLVVCRACMQRLIAAGQRPSFPKIEPYHIVAELGRGRFGVVYKAWRLNERPHLVALKILTGVGEAEQRRFEREAAVLARLDAPGIIKCLDHGMLDGRPYYVMDFVDGEHLDEHLVYQARTIDERLAVFARVCRVVAAAHAAGVVHRDLKPRNILIDAAGQAHVLDFGICALGPAEWSSSLRQTITQVGDLIGTLKYMSPEQAWGGASGPVDHRSDIWALGVMLYELVTDGQYPYELGGTPEKSGHEALLERIRHEMPRRVRLRHLPRGRDLEILLERTLAWDPRYRLDSALTLAEDIDRYLQGERIRTRAPSPASRVQRLAVGAAVRARWAVLAATVTVAVAFVFFSARLLDIRWKEPAIANDTGASAAAPMTDPRERIALVGVFDESIPAVLSYAEREQIPGVTQDVRTWRAVHGKLMQRLSQAQPLALLWDYYFATPREGDDEVLAAGANALTRAGVPVIFAAAQYDGAGRPVLSPILLAHLEQPPRNGSIVARDMKERQSQFVLASRRADGRVIPHVALTAYAAVREPACRLEIEWSEERSRQLELLYRAEPNLYLRERDILEAEIPVQTFKGKQAVQAGDIIAYASFPLSPPRYWQDRVIPYEMLLGVESDALAALVNNRAVLIADFRASRPGFPADRHTVYDEGEWKAEVPGGTLLADFLAGLLGRPALRTAFPLPWMSLALVILAALAGCFCAVTVARSTRGSRIAFRRLTVSAALVGAVAGLLLAGASQSSFTVQLALATASLSLAMLLAMGVEFARNRHRLPVAPALADGHMLGTAADTLSLNRPRATAPPSGP
ncbi:MAG: protein kinase [Phycisphaerae bacterium]|nr:protein kinase [Phycisphaerae bacterium]